VELNLSSLVVDESGRVSLSGLGSGIDFNSAVDQMIAARRIPVDRLETNIETNDLKILAYQDLQVLLGTFQNSLDTLRGAVSLDNTKDTFAAKQAFASVSRTDGATPALAANLVGVTVTNAATTGSHDVEVLQVARAHKIASDAYTSTTATLGFADGDQFTVEGTVITVAAQDTLLTLRDRINAANTGTTPTAVSASIVTVSSTEHYLVLSKDTAGTSITISDTTNTPLATVGILTGASPKNELQSAQTAQIYADGLLDKTNTTYESARQASATTALGSDGTLRFDDGTGAPMPVDIAYTSGQTITDLKNAINADTDLTGAGISASIVQEGTQFRLKIVTTGAAFTMTEQAAGTVLTDLAINNSRLLIERNTNTVNDLFAGITLSLFQAEVGTNVKLDIEQDLASVKSQVTTFVDAYNAVKTFINSQTQIDETTGAIPEDAVLFGTRALANIETRIDQILGVGVAGVSADYSVLAQVGITFVNNAALTDPLLEDTLEIDQSVLDTALLNDADDVRRLFSFDFSTSDPNLTLLSFSGQTTYSASGYTLNVAYNELYQGDATTTNSALTDADTAGPAEDGISAIALSGSVSTSGAFRYSYDLATETLTLRDLTAGTVENVDITASLDALVGVGLDLGAGETLAVDFATLGTITLSGDNGFLRGANIGDGTLDVSALHASTTMTGGAVTTPTSGMNKATVDALIAAGAFTQSSGLLTLGVTSSGSGEVHFDTAAGMKFRVDGGSVLADISAVDLDDLGAHTVDVYVNDGVGDVQVASLAFTTLASTLAGSGSLTIDLGTGLFAEANTAVTTTAPMANYLTITDGNFDIVDSSMSVIGNVAYTTDQSITDLKDTIDAISGITASIISSGGTFQLQILSDTSEPLTFENDTGSVVTQLNIINRGTSVASANVGGTADGADDGTITVANNILTVTSTSGAEGLQLLYTGNTDASALTVNFTTGVGAQMYFTVDDIVDEATGAVANEIDALDGQNDFNQERIDLLLIRLEHQRQSLLSRFIAMETALTQMNSILDSIKETFKVLTADN
jgi:flagellar hook-associated protein 2